MLELRFPKNFLWGAATSAHQVEGENNKNDWWQAERTGLLPHSSGMASDHYNLFAQDFDLAKKLGHNAHRFSLEWSRLEIRAGEFDEAATNHYRRVLLYLREQGIEPIVTLHHFTNPVWFADSGGWTNRKSPQIFARYVRYCLENFGDYVRYWVTINEPTAYANAGYGVGKWPPFQKSYLKVLLVLINMSRAHNRAYRLIHQITPKAKVSIAHNAKAFLAANSRNPLELIATAFYKFVNNDFFLILIRKNFDYIGLNYYFLQRVRWNKRPTIIAPSNATRSDLGWEIAPQGLLQVLRELHKF